MSEVISLFQRAKAFGIRLLPAMLLCIGAQHSYARTTWKLMQQFDRSIGCGYFFDEDHGLIGSGVRWGRGGSGLPCAIYKTTDGGVTWASSAVPTIIDGAVTSIYMVDSLTGFASIFSSADYSDLSTFGHSSLWKTTDGGNSWFDPFHLDHVLTSVYAQQGLMVITKWDQAEYSSPSVVPPDLAGGDYSYDSGKTWIPDFVRCNDVTFSDSLNGVITEMNDIPGASNFWVTTDAGRTWNSTSNQYESWSAHAVRGQPIFFCANESQYDLPHSSINWSTDSGYTWSERTYFPVMHFTGDLEGVGNRLYFQTDSTYYGDVYQTGLYRSDNLGATWHWIGGPTNSRDTRFVVTGCEGQTVYAFDGLGGVWKTTDGGDGTVGAAMSFDADSIRWTPAPCGDTLNFEALCSSCLPLTIDSAHILMGTELTLLSEAGTLPTLLQQNDSARISVRYAPTKGGQQSTIVRVYAHSGEQILGRDITIITTNTQASDIALSKDTAILAVGSCSSVIDSVTVLNVGCQDLILDSVVMPSGDAALLSELPRTISDSTPLQLSFIYQPKATEVEIVHAHLYAHSGLRSFDTIITLELRSSFSAPTFALDSTTLSITTNFCQPRIENVHFSVVSCDSVWIDSIISSNPNFITSSNSALLPHIRDSLRVTFEPDSEGTQLGIIRIVAHSQSQTFDTTLSVTGINNALPQSIVLSQTSLAFATAGCVPLSDTVSLANEGCDSLLLDSIRVSDDSEVSISFDSSLLPLGSGDRLPIRIIFDPGDGRTKVTSAHLFLHTPSHKIDTIITLTTSNAIPAEPLAFSSDSLYLFTKYCQPISMPIVLTNNGCQPATIDSEVIRSDSFDEFSVTNEKQSIATNNKDTMSVQFTPARAGICSAQMKVYLHIGNQPMDTTLLLTAKNLTAPVPYLPRLPSQMAGSLLSIPIMLEPTADTFSIRRYAFHLSFNTDLLTPVGLSFTNTSSSHVVSHTLNAEPGSGCSGEVWLADTISDTSQLSLPLVYVLANVSLANDSETMVTLDSFATDREPAMELCSIPEQPFTFLPQCDDPLLLDEMRGEPLSFDILSVAPNPASDGDWDIDYRVNLGPIALTLDITNIAGESVYHSTLIEMAGTHSQRVPIPRSNGNYFVTMSNGWVRRTLPTTVLR